MQESNTQWEILNDIRSYLLVCEYAAKDERVFSNFKKEPAYRQILGAQVSVNAPCSWPWSCGPW